MFSRRNVFPAVLAALLGVAAPALAATKTGPATRFDADNDGTVDIDERGQEGCRRIVRQTGYRQGWHPRCQGAKGSPEAERNSRRPIQTTTAR